MKIDFILFQSIRLLTILNLAALNEKREIVTTQLFKPVNLQMLLLGFLS